MTIDRAELERALFALGDHVRYVAFGVGQDIHTAQSGTPEGASDASSDFYEELLVNPTLLTLARQRGDLDLRRPVARHRGLRQLHPGRGPCRRGTRERLHRA